MTTAQEARKAQKRKKHRFVPSKRQKQREKSRIEAAPREPVDGNSSSPSGDVHDNYPLSVIIPIRRDYMFNPNAWSDLSSIPFQNTRTKEVTFNWEESLGQEEQLVTIAKQAANKTDCWFEEREDPMKTLKMFRMLNMVASMKTFVKHCRANLRGIQGYRLKLSVMHGATATRCPLWHCDNVPVRWIQTFYGPGCEYVEEDEKNRTASTVPNPLLDRVRASDNGREAPIHGSQWKTKLVEMSEYPIRQSSLGEPTMFIGHKWNTFAFLGSEMDDDAPVRSAVLHRSPQNVPEGMGRVLLNLDVVCDADDTDGHHNHDHSKQRSTQPSSQVGARRTINVIPGAAKKKKGYLFKKSGKKKNGGKKCGCCPTPCK